MKQITLKAVIFLLLTAVAPAGYAQSAEARQQQFNLDHALALQGYDPVSYFRGKPTEGKKEIQTVYKGVRYYFSSSADRDAFVASPEKYEPQYGGWCAYAMGEKGEKVSVDPETFKIIDGKLYLFYNRFFNNTLETWNKNEKNLKAQADKNWSSIHPIK